jgi:hypothetical protein
MPMEKFIVPRLSLWQVSIPKGLKPDSWTFNSIKISNTNIFKIQKIQQNKNEIVWVLLTVFPKSHGEQQSYCAQQLVNRKTSKPTCSPFHSFNKESHRF